MLSLAHLRLDFIVPTAYVRPVRSDNVRAAYTRPTEISGKPRSRTRLISPYSAA
jgi:hypothetical protein